MKNIVLLCYGQEIEYNRAIFAILSFLAWNRKGRNDYRIICYTDNPTYISRYVKGITVEFVNLTPAYMQDMLGGSSYIHRRKICVLQDVNQRYPGDDLAFMDSDTFFIADSSRFIEQLQLGVALMHEREYTIEQAPENYRRFMSKRLIDAERYPLAFIKLIEDLEFDYDGKKISFAKTQYVWNSGVLGIKGVDLCVLNSVLELSDLFFAKTEWFISEQLAFGLLLQDKLTLKESSAFVNHYYLNKKRVDPIINKFLNANSINLPLPKKLESVINLTKAVDKLIKFDNLAGISLGAFRRKNFKKGFLFAFKALGNILIHPILFSYVKASLGQNGKNSVKKT